MSDIPTSLLFLLLFFLILLSAFFSGSETGLMSLNRYRLKHLAAKNHGGARRAAELLKDPDRLISLILLGNNFINILITQLATYLGYRLYNDIGIAIATGLLTLVLLIFAEVTPKTLAARKPEKIAYPASYIYKPMLTMLSPLVSVINWMASRVQSLFGLHHQETINDALNSDELRIAVQHTSGLIPDSHRDMLIGILDLETVKVEDIMVPRNEIVGIDLNTNWSETRKQITKLPYTRIPVYRDNIDNLVGQALMRKILPLITEDEFNPDSLQRLIREPLFIPEGTSLTTQLINFQQHKRRMGFVVDEYGDIQGLVALEDILEEIVGEFTTDHSSLHQDFQQDKHGNFLIDGGSHIREINRTLNIHLPTNGPKTLNGLILEHLEIIPEADTSLRINEYTLEIKQVKNNMVKTVRLALPEQPKSEQIQPHG